MSHGGDSAAVEKPGGTRKYDLFFGSDVRFIELPELVCRSQDFLRFLSGQTSSSNPCTVKGLYGGMQFVCMAMIANQCGYLPPVIFGGLSAKAREEGIFLVGIMPPAAFLEIMKRGFDCFRLFRGQGSAASAFGYEAENVKEAFDPSVAIGEHSDWVIESAVGFGANLYSHVLGSLQYMKIRCCLQSGQWRNVIPGDVRAAGFFAVGIACERIGASA